MNPDFVETPPMNAELVTATFLFTDLEDSTSLWESHPGPMQLLSTRHDALVRQAIEASRGRVVKTTGDGFHAVFDHAADGVAAALAAQRALLAATWPVETGPPRVRLGLHTGRSRFRDGDYYGAEVNRAARVMGVAHGGQILLSEATAALVRHDLPPQVSLKALGRHRLRGLATEELLSQLCHPELPDDFPPLDSLSILKHNLPLQTTPFIGRDGELAELMDLLADPGVRLVTIVAPGGMGKTRLSLAAASQQLESSRFPDGIYFVNLAPVSEPALIPAAIAEAMKANLYGGDPIEQQLIRHLQNQRLLLLLDNFEQLGGGAGLPGRLLAAVPGLKLLVTSRQLLNLSQEWALDLAGLPYPDEGVLGDPGEIVGKYSGVNLLVQRLRQMESSFRLTAHNLPDVVRICRLAGGMPLGLELAATWKPLMTLREIGDEIDRNLDFLSTHLQDVPERHRSLRAVFQHSWNLLTGEERATFCRLSLFGADFSREAALQVTGSSLMVLVALIRKSLLRRTEEGRYQIQELLRQYAAEMLASNPDEKQAAQEAYAAFFASFLHQRENALNGDQQLIALDEIDQEIDHIFQVWRWAVGRSDAQVLDRMMNCLSVFVDIRGAWLQTGHEAFRQAIEKLRALLGPEPAAGQQAVLGRLLVRWAWLYTRVTGKDQGLDPFLEGIRLIRAAGAEYRAELPEALNHLALDYYFIGQASQAWEAAREALAIAKEIGTPGLDSYALNVLGHLAEFQGKYRQAEAYFQASINSYDVTGEARGRAYAVNNWGRAAYGMGAYELAGQLIGEALATRQQLDDQIGISYSLLDMGILNLLRGRYDEAEDHIQVSLAITQRIGLSETAARGYHGLGWLAMFRRQYRQAATHHGRSLAMFRQLSVRRALPLTLNGLAAAVLPLGELEQAEEYLEESLLISRELDNVGDEAVALQLLGELASARGHAAEAARHFQQALAIVHETGAAPTALETILGVARLYLAGEDQRRNQVTALLALVSSHPASAQYTRDRAAEMLESLPADLKRSSPDAETLPDLWQTVGELIQTFPNEV